MLLNLIFLLVATAHAVTLLFVLTSLVHSKAAGVREWKQANGIAVLGLVLVAARDLAPDILSIEVANGLLMITLGLIYAGFRRHLSLAVPSLPLVLGGVLALGGLVFFHYVFDSAALRILSVSIYHAAVSFAIVATIPTTSDPYLRYPFVFTRVAALVLGAANTLRGALFARRALCAAKRRARDLDRHRHLEPGVPSVRHAGISGADAGRGHDGERPGAARGRLRGRP